MKKIFLISLILLLSGCIKNKAIITPKDNLNFSFLSEVYLHNLINIEDGDTFFPEFDINDFEVLIGETLGEEVKYTRTFYVRKK